MPPLTLSTAPIMGLATPPGHAAVAVVRLSGSDCRDLVLPLLETPAGEAMAPRHLPPRTLRLARLMDPEAGEPLDHVLVCWFPAPHSFTGEEQMELHPHGAPVVVQRLLHLLAERGFRVAQPGEFSRRAFLNDKIDLLQAEAILSLIQAASLRAARVAAHQAEGSLTRALAALKEEAADLLAHVEASLDFTDEEIDPHGQEEMIRRLDGVAGEITRLLTGAELGERLREGFRVVLAGRPNVGKSSLFNRLVGRDKAIVTDIPGTTRDINEAELVFHGVPVTLMDTAGLREGAEVVEQEGIRRARTALGQADGILYLLDAPAGLTPEDREHLLPLAPERTVVVWHKSDATPAPGSPEEAAFLAPFHPVAVSSRTGAGLDELSDRLSRFFGHQPLEGEGLLLLMARQREALIRAAAAVQEALTALHHPSPPLEVAALALRQALDALGELTGAVSHDAILDRIFSRFCIGK